MAKKSSSTKAHPASRPRDSSRRRPPMHPGEMLREEFMVPMQLSANALALALRVPVTRVSEIVNERRGITADTAHRLAIYFGMSSEFWMNLQTSYELSSIAPKALQQIRKEVRTRSGDCALSGE